MASEAWSIATPQPTRNIGVSRRVAMAHCLRTARREQTHDDGEPTEIFTDEYAVYNTLDESGYLHDTVCHSAREYVKYRKEIADDGTYETTEVHTNTLEGFWSYPKGAQKVVHRGVSEKYLPGYLAEYTYRYNHRNDETPMFFSILRRAVRVAPL